MKRVAHLDGRTVSGGLQALTRALPVIGLTWLAGCTSLQPAYERPGSPVPPGWDDAATPLAISAEAPSDIEWQRFYEDERLKTLIGIALHNNRDLRVAVLNIESARAQYQIQRADRLPTVDAGISASRIPGTEGNQTSLYTVGLSVTAYELDFFGRVRSLQGVALADFLATQEARKAAQISLIASVASTYLSRQADDSLIALAQRTLDAQRASLELTRLRFEHGAASELDVRSAETQIESARVALAQAQAQRARDDNALALLVGQALPADLPVGRLLEASTSGPVLPAGLPSELLLRRPDIRQAEQRLLSANANIGAARAALLPRITLTGSAGVASTELSALFSSGTFAWTFSPQLLVPIFDSGRGRANVSVAEIRRDVAVANYESAIQAAFREVADSLAARASLEDEARAQSALEAAEAARLRLAELRYRHGVASSLELLDAQRSVFAARQGLVQVRLSQLQNQVILYKALAGGWKEADPN